LIVLNPHSSTGYFSKRYLEISDWCLQEAIRSAREDIEWELGDVSNGSSFGDIKTVSTNTPGNPSTSAQFQQSLGVLNTISAAAATAAANAAAVLNRSTLVSSRSNLSKKHAVESSSQNVSCVLNDNDDDDDCDSFIACDDEATATTSNNNFEYVMNHTNDTSCTSQYDVESHAIVLQDNHVIQHEMRTNTTGTAVMLHDIPGAIATKSVHVQDIYKVKL
jgi:hypothetical protein